MIPKHIYDEAKKFVNASIAVADEMLTDDMIVAIFNKDKTRETLNGTAHTIMDANVIIHRYEQQQADATTLSHAE